MVLTTIIVTIHKHVNTYYAGYEGTDSYGDVTAFVAFIDRCDILGHSLLVILLGRASLKACLLLLLLWLEKGLGVRLRDLMLRQGLK